MTWWHDLTDEERADRRADHDHINDDHWNAMKEDPR